MKFSDLIIYTDVDGTAATHINYQGMVSDANLQAIEEFIKEGGMFGVASGRNHPSIDQIFQNIQDTSHLIEGVVEKINEVDQVATNVAEISEEQAASSDEILATSESMLQQAKSITKNSEQVEAEAGNLAESADQLADQVKQFQI